MGIDGERWGREGKLGGREIATWDQGQDNIKTDQCPVQSDSRLQGTREQQTYLMSINY